MSVDTKGQHIGQSAAFVKQDNAIYAAVLDCYYPAMFILCIQFQFILWFILIKRKEKDSSSANTNAC